MLGLQTIACLHDIPVIRSSTDIVQNVYAKAKDTSVLIRVPCSVAEVVADKSLKIALLVANPFFMPFRGPVRIIDDYAAQKLRQIESKYPAINTPTDEVVNTFNEKTEPVRHVMNSVKGSTTSTIQHGKETVSHVASATVNKATGVAGSVLSFCEAHGSGGQRRDSNQSKGLSGFLLSTIGSLVVYLFQSVQSSLIWFRMLGVFFLLKLKQINDLVLNKMPRKPLLTIVLQRFLIVSGAFLAFFIERIRPDDRTLTELKKTKQQARTSQQPQYFVNRPSLKVDPAVATRQSVVVTKQETVISRPTYVEVLVKPRPDYSNMTDSEELIARLTNGDLPQSTRRAEYDYEQEHSMSDSVRYAPKGDIAQLHEQVNPTDVELLYSRLPADVISTLDDQEPLTVDQQMLHARLIGADLDRQGYAVDEDEEYDE